MKFKNIFMYGLALGCGISAPPKLNQDDVFKQLFGKRSPVTRRSHFSRESVVVDAGHTARNLSFEVVHDISLYQKILNSFLQDRFTVSSQALQGGLEVTGLSDDAKGIVLNFLNFSDAVTLVTQTKKFGIESFGTLIKLSVTDLLQLDHDGHIDWNRQNCNGESLMTIASESIFQAYKAKFQK